LHHKGIAYTALPLIIKREEAMKKTELNKQIEITERQNLLNEDGTLARPGYCKRNLFVYNRENITAPKRRIKEWDFYQFSDDKFSVQMNFANISLASGATIGVIDLESGKKWEAMKVSLKTHAKELNRNGDAPYSFGIKDKSFDYSVNVTEDKRELYFKGKGSRNSEIEIDITAKMQKGLESLTIATPFSKPAPNRFFFTQKINCMPVTGTVKINDFVKEFSPKNTFLVLDWGRGVWPYSNMWYWGNGSCFLDGKLFGFEITWGFGNEEAATETALFYDGKCHKIGRVWVDPDPEVGGKWMSPWHFHSEDGRFEMTMMPYFDHFVNLNLGLLKMVTHQVYGTWSGKVILDDGKELVIENMHAFCEKVYNKW
jgi:hypothetical protein